MRAQQRSLLIGLVGHFDALLSAQYADQRRCGWGGWWCVCVCLCVASSRRVGYRNNNNNKGERMLYICVTCDKTTTSSINQVGISHRQLNKLYRTLLLSLGYLVKSSGQMHVPTLWDTSMVQSQVNHRRSSLLLVCTGTRHSIMISINDRYCTKPIKRSIEHSSRLRLSLHCQPAWRRITNRENDPRTHTHI